MKVTIKNNGYTKHEAQELLQELCRYYHTIDKEKGKISLSLKDASMNPWALAVEKYAVGTVVEGKVVRMVPFGAFVELAPGKDGMCHIKDLEFKRTEKVEDVLNVGDKTWVKFTGVDEKGRWNISRKEALKERGEK